MATLALRKRKGGPWAWLIRRWTRGPYDHCELVTAAGRWYSSLLWSGGVRMVETQPEGEWDFVPLPWLSDAAVEAHYEATKDQGYDWLAILGQVVRGRWQLSNATMCSEWCAQPMGLPQPPAFDPVFLGQTAQWGNELWSNR